jgi:hypothetical protein
MKKYTEPIPLYLLYAGIRICSIVTMLRAGISGVRSLPGARKFSPKHWKDNKIRVSSTNNTYTKVNRYFIRSNLKFLHYIIHLHSHFCNICYFYKILLLYTSQIRRDIRGISTSLHLIHQLDPTYFRTAPGVTPNMAAGAAIRNPWCLLVAETPQKRYAV